MRAPEFDNLLRILNREKPERATLFEFFLNTPLYEKTAGFKTGAGNAPHTSSEFNVAAFKGAGYDYATVYGSSLCFPAGEQTHGKTVSMNEGAVITDRKSFEQYSWPDPDKLDYSGLDSGKSFLEPGMKFIACGPGGVLENVMKLAGYEALCYMIMDDPELTGDIFDAVGSRLVRHYEICASFDSVGAIISNDDWGFKTQTMLSVDDMRKYVFPWHKKIVATAHKAGKPAILHSCGQLEAVMNDITDSMKYDGKHSYEDAILPVEDAYDRWGARIAVMGGIDLDFICRSTPRQVYERSKRMLDRTSETGAYALGSGNSIPEYVPQENYFAMTSAALNKNKDETFTWN